MSERFVCDKCGEELLPEAKFCGKCGSKVDRIPLGTVDEQTQANQGVGNTCIAKAVPKNFRSVIAAIWLAIGLRVLLNIIGLFDVCVYYSLGRFGWFLFSVGWVALLVWLVKKIAERKNWARVTYIAFSLLFCVLSIFGLVAAEDNNGFCLFIDLIELVVTLYCIVQLLNERMVSCFVKTADGVTRALVFWGVFIACVFIVGIYADKHEKSDAYPKDCAKAALRGSGDAYGALIEYAIAQPEYHGSAGEILDAATRDVDAYIAQVASEGNCAPERKEAPQKSRGRGWGDTLIAIVKGGSLLSALWARLKNKKK